VVEEAPADPEPLAIAAARDRPSHVLTISAKTPEALRELAGRYRELLAGGAALADVAYSAKHRTGALRPPVAVVAASSDAAGQRWTASSPVARRRFCRPAASTARSRPTWRSCSPGRARSTGHGAAAFETQPTFRRSLERADELSARSWAARCSR